MDTKNPLLEEDDDAFLASLNQLLGEEPEPDEEPQADQPPFRQTASKKKTFKKIHHPKPSRLSKKALTVLAAGLGAAALPFPLFYGQQTPTAVKSPLGSTWGP